jgi:hypothetical protein
VKNSKFFILVLLTATFLSCREEESKELRLFRITDENGVGKEFRYYPNGQLSHVYEFTDNGPNAFTEYNYVDDKLTSIDRYVKAMDGTYELTKNQVLNYVDDRLSEIVQNEGLADEILYASFHLGGRQVKEL